MKIGYTGEVTITAGNCRNVVHNSGSDSLFRLLSVIFGRRDSFTNDDLPGTMMIYDEDVSDVLSSSVTELRQKEVLSSPVIVNFYPEAIQENSKMIYQTVFTTYITNRNVSKTLTTDTPTLALLDGSATNILAAVSLNSSSGVMDSILQGNQAMIKWIMHFANA
jgi:hypothetical protein